MDASDILNRKSLVIAGVCMFLLLLVVACKPLAAPSSAPADDSAPLVVTGVLSGAEVISSDGGDPADVDLIYATETQCSSLFDLNMARTQEAAPHNLFWTWHLNFNLQPTNVPGVDFFGCLHFFWREERPREFYPAAEYILTPCRIVDAGVVPLSISAGSNMLTSFGTHTVPTTAVRFSGESRIECDLNLGKIGIAYAETDELLTGVDSYWTTLTTTNTVESVQNIVQGELTRLWSESPIQYPSFSLGGVASNLGETQSPSQQPIVSYHPDCDPSLSCTNLWLEPNVLDFPLVGVQGGIAAQVYSGPWDSLCLRNPSSACIFRQRESPWLYIMEYGQTDISDHAAFDCAEPVVSGNQSFLAFHAKIMNNEVGDWWKWCPEDIAPNIYLTPSPNGLEDPPPYWTRETTIFIGYNPEDDVYLDGTLYEAWIEPDGSGTTGGG